MPAGPRPATSTPRTACAPASTAGRTSTPRIISRRRGGPPTASAARLIAPVVVIDVRAACAADPDHAVTAEEMRAFEAKHGPIPKGRWSLPGRGGGALAGQEALPRRRHAGRRLAPAFPGLLGRGGPLPDRRPGIAGVGIDTASVDPGPSRDFAATRSWRRARPTTSRTWPTSAGSPRGRHPRDLADEDRRRVGGSGAGSGHPPLRTPRPAGLASRAPLLRQ